MTSGLRSTLSDRQALWAFVLGCVAVTAGVLLHLPMFLMSRSMGYHMAGMPMDTPMLIGMFLIVAGVFVAAYGLLPRNFVAHRGAVADITISAPEDAVLGAPHWKLMTVLVIALVVDVMKPAALGFVVPGMAVEYRVSRETASLIAFSALVGTVVGSVLWGIVADIYGRRASILLSAVMFVGTSICGAMPSLAWNVGMCFMMGAAAGGMLPVAYALLAEMMPSRHRGWSLVLVGGLGALGGYLAASGVSALLQPIFGWRILWLVNLPTGLLLVMLGGYIPESAKFLISRGREHEAEAVMRRFGAVARRIVEETPRAAARGIAHSPLTGRHLIGKLAGLSIGGLSWGFISFGLLLWLPADLIEKGYSVGASSRLLAESALISFPTVFLAALIYSRWSTKWSLVATLGVTIAGLLGVMWLELSGGGGPVLPVALLIVGSNGLLAVILPYTAESFPLRVRGRATGWVAACTKTGGLIAQGLAITALVPTMTVVAGLIIVPTMAALVLVAWFGRETLGRDLRELDDEGQHAAA
ncbi:putative MFS transporter [Hephaestia caeni]|uniref:Putative MFS transporter n=1 Tax=Hephaestia caeni TaxID=645617 RepID=A0A397P8Y7_9SPHN|nr:MFS transporter [Hephaestia caeni]RIA43637.1 putative MFS transporter [Hephaestia caeni]